MQKGTVCVGNGVGICCFSLDGNPIGNKEQDDLNSFFNRSNDSSRSRSAGL